MVSAAKSDPRFVPASEIRDYREQIAMAKEETRKTREAAKKQIEEETTRFRSTYPLKLEFPYRFRAFKQPFNVSSIFNDGQFTYIRANPLFTRSKTESPTSSISSSTTASMSSPRCSTAATWRSAKRRCASAARTRP